MKRIFRTYSCLNATVFDLLSGDNEVRQTKALAYLLSQDKLALQSFLNLEEISGITGKLNLNQFDKVVVHSEMISDNNKRADIVIKLYQKRSPKIAIIIEAKSAKTTTSSQSILNQLTEYLIPDEFSELTNFELYGCSLTKNDIIMHAPRITAISWNTIFEMLNGKTGLSKDFLKYISNIKGVMKFYEKEVYSVPAGKTYEHLYNYPNIYECPNKGNYTSMKKPLFVTFRKGSGGEMELLFGVDDIIIMNPKSDLDSFMKNTSYSGEIKKRVMDYCNNRWGKGNYDNEEKQFFILSQSNQIKLKHKPKPKKNNAFRAYYKLSELLDANKKIVETDSN